MNPLAAAGRGRRPAAAPVLVGLVVGVLALAGCGEGADDGDPTVAGPTESAGAAGAQGAAAAAEQSDEQPARGPEEGDGASAAAAGGDGPSATLTLANGETLTFSVMCGLEPQEVAGSVIEFTAVSYDDPGLDVTQFGEEGTVRGHATVTVVQGESYETLWEARSNYEPFGGTLELSLEGSTITGSGSFFPGADIDADPVDGELVVTC